MLLKGGDMGFESTTTHQAQALRNDQTPTRHTYHFYKINSHVNHLIINSNKVLS